MEISRRSLLHSWRLFGLLAFIVSALSLVELFKVGLQSTRATLQIVLWTVRCAIPLFLVAFCASSLAVLWRGRLTRWLLSNRRYFGLAFAVGMLWHLSFVAYWLVTSGKHLSRMILAMDLMGLVSLIVLSLTSFRYFARRMSLRSWRVVHKAGVYWIWLLLAYIYAAGARDRDPYYVGMFLVLLAALALRCLAWARVRTGRKLGAAAPSRPAY